MFIYPNLKSASKILFAKITPEPINSNLITAIYLSIVTKTEGRYL